MLQTLFAKVITVAVTALLSATPLWFFHQDALQKVEDELAAQKLGAASSFQVVQAQKFKLAGSGITSSATTITLQSFLLPDASTTITMAHLGTTGYGTLEPGTSKEEQISFTGVTQNGDGTATLTGVTRGLDFRSNTCTAVSANQKAHAGGSIFILADTACFYGNLITYINNVASSGAAAASETVDGLVELATPSELEAGTATGGTGARLVAPNSRFNATSSATTTVPVTRSSGKLSQGFLDLTESFTLSGGLTSSATTTLSGPISIAATSSAVTVHTATSTYTKPSNLKYIVVEVVGGGGGGGGTTNSSEAGGGGGAGGYARELLRASQLSATTSISIGPAGAAGAGGACGGNGGPSSFGAFLSANGGTGGGLGAGEATGGAGGTATGGDLNINGATGGDGAAIAGFATSGAGGNGILGAGGSSVSQSAGSTTGYAGTGYGAGGSGAASDDSSADTSGGAGSQGVVIIYEFFL